MLRVNPPFIRPARAQQSGIDSYPGYRCYLHSNGLHHTYDIRTFNLNGYVASCPCDLSLCGFEQHDTAAYLLFSNYHKESDISSEIKKLCCPSFNKKNSGCFKSFQFSTVGAVRQSHRFI